MRDIDAGLAAFFNFMHEVDDLAHLLEGEGHRRLVQDDDLRLEVHGPPDRNTLALAAGQLVHF